MKCLLIQCIFNQVHNLQFLHSGGKVRIRCTRVKIDDSIFQCSPWNCGFQILLLFSVSYEILHFKLQMFCLLTETVKTDRRPQDLSLVYNALICGSVTQSLNTSLPVLCRTQCRRSPVIILRYRGCTMNKSPVHCRATGPYDKRDKQPFTLR